MWQIVVRTKRNKRSCNVNLKTIMAGQWLRSDEVAEMLMGVRHKSSDS